MVAVATRLVHTHRAPVAIAPMGCARSAALALTDLAQAVIANMMIADLGSATTAHVLQDIVATLVAKVEAARTRSVPRATAIMERVPVVVAITGLVDQDIVSTPDATVATSARAAADIVK